MAEKVKVELGESKIANEKAVSSQEEHEVLNQSFGDGKERKGGETQQKVKSKKHDEGCDGKEDRDYSRLWGS